MHKSVRLEVPCEFINVTPLNPLISKCQIKVCYVGEQPNRNRSIITKDVARKMANSLPGSPIVGYFNENKKDFEEHNRTIDISNGKFEIKDTTRPYGFVDLNAKVWFQKYLDDDSVEREYLVTEGYLWTGQYPECQRAVEGEGNNQSMELDKDRIDAFWTKNANGKHEFFIINEAIVSKLCILGEDCEPCFEGASVTAPDEFVFSLGDEFKEQLFSMMQQIKDLLEGGETQVFTRYAVEIGDALWSALYSYIEKTYPDSENTWRSIYRIEGVFEESGQKFAVLQNRDDMKYFKLVFSLSEAEGLVPAGELQEVTKTYQPAAEPQFALEDVETFENEYKKKKEDEEAEADKEKEKTEDKEGKSDNSNSDNTSEEEKSKSSEEGKKDEDEEDEEKKKKTKYSLEEIPEYVELLTKFSELESKYNALVEEKSELDAQLQPLMKFKADSEKKEKEDMIASFYMLSDEDKKDVIENINTYSLEDIEAKLSIICVRNKVSFAEEGSEGSSTEKDPTVYNLGGNIIDDAVPAWVKAAMNVAKDLK